MSARNVAPRIPAEALETLQYCVDDGLQEIATCRANYTYHHSLGATVCFLRAVNRLQQARVRLHAIDADIAERRRYLAMKGGAT